METSSSSSVSPIQGDKAKQFALDILSEIYKTETVDPPDDSLVEDDDTTPPDKDPLLDTIESSIEDEDDPGFQDVFSKSFFQIQKLRGARMDMLMSTISEPEPDDTTTTTKPKHRRSEAIDFDHELSTEEMYQNGGSFEQILEVYELEDLARSTHARVNEEANSFLRRSRKCLALLASIAVHAATRHEEFRDSRYAALLVKDAVAETHIKLENIQN